MLHLRSCAELCLPGAGSSLPAAGRLSLSLSSQSTPWLLSYLQSHGSSELADLSATLARLGPQNGE